MVAAADAQNYAQKLGITRDLVVQELGWDEDTDDDLRADVEDAIVLLWWRDGDGDLVDALMDAIGPLSDDGFVWVLSPKTGLPGHVEPSEIAESAPTAGLTQTSAQNLGDWIGSRLVQPKTQATKR